MHPGQRVGKYVLGERIAVGGMAEVWAARAEGPEGFVKPVALKVMLESFSGDPELEKLFVKEARIAAQLQHANLVSVFDFDKVVIGTDHGGAGRYYIAMEHVEGHDARRVAQAAKHAGYLFPLPLALYLGGEVMKGLRYVHERRAGGRPLGLVHRDVSPHNVLVGFSGEVKLSDFGIAKSLAHSSRTKTGTIRGKICYASPEQLAGGPVDHRTDQFAMGITLWEILAGRPLFDGPNELAIIGQVMRCEVPPLALASPERAVPGAIEAVVRRMLSPRREDRYASSADALAALLALPGYTGDGAALGELVRTLFHRGAGELSSTAPIQDPAAQAQLRKRPIGGRGMASPAAGRAPHEAPAAKAAGAVETKTLARPPARGARARTSDNRSGQTPATVHARPEARRGRPMVAAAIAAGVAVTLVVVAVVMIASRASSGSPPSATQPVPQAANASDPSPPVRAPAPSVASPSMLRRVAASVASPPGAPPAGEEPARSLHHKPSAAAPPPAAPPGEAPALAAPSAVAAPPAAPAADRSSRQDKAAANGAPIVE